MRRDVECRQMVREREIYVGWFGERVDGGLVGAVEEMEA